MKRRSLLSIVLFILSAGYIFHTIEVEELGEAISRANTGLLLLAFGMAFASILVSSLRWYLVLKNVQEASFRKTLRAVLSGFYLMVFLPPSVGHATKVKLVGGDYFRALSALAFGIAIEFLMLLGISLVVFGATMWGVILLGLLLVLVFYDRAAYTLLQWGARIAQKVSPSFAEKIEDYLRRAYSGWKAARRNPRTFITSVFLSTLAILLQMAGIIVVGRAFGLPVGDYEAIKAFVLSTVFASISGIPSGIGANELGITLALGPSTKSALVAFTYKFLYQYMWAFLGGIEFYMGVGSK